MLMLDSINQFVETMVSEKETFEKIQGQIDNTENNVKKIVSSLESDIRSNTSKLSKSEIIQKDAAVQAIFKGVTEIVEKAAEDTNNIVQETIKGMTFIQDFEKKFTIAVFGKVKAGKSYIGNFIMGNTLKDFDIPSAYDQLRPITVTVYDRGKSSSQEQLSTIEEKESAGDSLEVGITETTSTIQWFDIGGLSWFDTPGIGSVTWENEMLAKEYVKNSDLVIYACNSDAAGTRQDFAEMKQLLDMKKPLLLLLTQSDTLEEDEDEDGEIISKLVPKSDKDRSDQEQYMLQTIKEQGMTDILKYADVLTVSAKLANNALKSKDEQMFDASNMGKLLEILTDITKTNAADLKRNTPKDRINKLIDDTCACVSEMAHKVDSLCAGIKKNQDNLKERQSAMVENIRNDARNKVIIMLDKFKNQIQTSGGTVNESEIVEEVGKIINKCISDVCMNELNLNRKNVLEINISGIGSMEMKKDTIEYQVSNVVEVERDPKGILEKAGAFFFDKKYYKHEVRTSTKTKSFDIGINNNELAGNLMKQMDDIFKHEVDAFVNSLVNGYYEPISILRNNVNKLASDALKKLSDARMN